MLPCGGGMCYYVTTDGLLWVSLKHGRPVDLSHNLVCDDHSHTKLQEEAEQSRGARVIV